ncbi:phospholipase-like protein [Tanacetum coccineum]
MANTRRVWKLVRYSVSKGLDTAYWGFLEHEYIISSLMDTAYWLSEQSYGTPKPQDEIAGPDSLSPDRRGLVKIWHVCKPIHVTYDDGCGKDCRMWPTCDPDSKFCFGYNEVFGVNEQGTLRIGHNNLHESDREFIFNEWILDSYNVKEEYAKEIGDLYSRRFLTNITKETYQQYYKKTNEAWHKEGYEEDEMWLSGDDKTDYDPPYVNVKTFEVKKYSFKGGRSFICINDREDEALPLGRVNGARFKAMIRKELEGNKNQKLGGAWVADWQVRGASKEDFQRFSKAQLDVFGRASFGWAYWSQKDQINES